MRAGGPLPQRRRSLIDPLKVEGQWLQKGAGEGGQPLGLRIPKVEVRLRVEVEGGCVCKRER